MYGLYHSTGANILEFLCFYLVQNVVPAALIITTPKSSPLRYLCIPGMISRAGSSVPLARLAAPHGARP
ncbi:hypothetical protein ACN42_g8683 [Penicillium freii]|uniref:Uncharacterized protein n=1 Tax=Penicillium freii TaxID=48697 RepID=A0A101MDA7_PENFR|nr:hypothetical protein ACN42_g8683 [Penicillium freii]